MMNNIGRSAQHLQGVLRRYLKLILGKKYCILPVSRNTSPKSATAFENRSEQRSVDREMISNHSNANQQDYEEITQRNSRN